LSQIYGLDGCLRWRDAVVWNFDRGGAKKVHVVAVLLDLSVRRKRHVTECLLFPDDPVQSIGERQKTEAIRQFQRAHFPRLMAALLTPESLPNDHHRMGFVRIACPEGDKDRQSSIRTGDPMEKDGGHICMLDPFSHLDRPLLRALVSLRFANGQPRSATKTCLGNSSSFKRGMQTGELGPSRWDHNGVVLLSMRGYGSLLKALRALSVDARAEWNLET
jgi:hypothetical protein